MKPAVTAICSRLGCLRACTSSDQSAFGEALRAVKHNTAASLQPNALRSAICTLWMPQEISCLPAPSQSVGKTAGFVAMGVAAGALMSALTVDVAEMAVMGAGGPT